MRWFQTTRKDGLLEYRPAYKIYDFPYETLRQFDTTVYESKKNARVYSTCICTLDIETTSYNDNESTKGFMYIWQACIGGVCIYGRYWEEFFALLTQLHKYLKGRIVFYIHNLGYEYQFIYRYLVKYYQDIEVFAPQRRKPLTVRFSRFELRCSWKLSNMTLNKATKTELGCLYVKSVGDLDYRIYRDVWTHLTDTEFTYCMMDVLALYHYITAKLNNEGDTLASTPLTSTGYVRRDCRRVCTVSDSYMGKYHRQTMSPMVYTLLKETGRGGDTAANYRLANQEIADVDSYDVASSYPYQMLTQPYPSSRFKKYSTSITEGELEKLCDGRTPVLFRCAFHGLHMKESCVDLYLPFSKCIAHEGKIRQANGRIMYAANITYTFTDIDWGIVKDCYTWDKVYFTDIYVSKYELLPEELRSVILDYFRQKCELKEKLQQMECLGLDNTPEYYDTAYLYAKSKNRLNGIFGMCFTDPVHDEIIVDYLYTGAWSLEESDIEEELKKLRSYSNNFLVYCWGAWTTAHARNHLHRLTYMTGERTIYWDTDSDKFIRSLAVSRRIEKENEKIRALCRERGAYIDTGNHVYYLGVYEHESDSPYQLFKTIGAKKYCYVDRKGELHLTVSGVACHPGEPLLPDGARELGTITNFKRGFIFHEAGGLTLYHNEDKIHTLRSRIHPDLEFTCGANIGTEDSTYTLGITKEYAAILGIDITDD